MLAPLPRLSRTDRWLAFALTLATVLLMAGTHEPIGYVRDEGYYFTAASRYEGWFLELGRSISSGRLLHAFDDDVITRYWGYNHEHPVLVKTLFALSHLVFTRWLGWMDDATAFRFPAFVFSGLVTLSLFLLARPFGRAAAVLAPALFWAVPRHFFHGHLAAFDIPVVATWCGFLWAYARALSTARGAWVAGLMFGLALATKHNAFFLPFVVVLHWLVTDRRDLRAAGIVGAIGRVPAAMWAMAILGPVVLYLHWPYLWHHPIDRIDWWLSFHRKHVHYPWQYLGMVLRAPPFPWAYPLVLEWLTLPLTTLVAVLLASGHTLVRAAGTFVDRVRERVGGLDDYEWLLLLGGAVSIAPFLTTQVPIFGGIKHWMPAVAIACVFAARLVCDAARALVPKAPLVLQTAVSAAILVPAAIYTAHFHPWGTSAYNELAGAAGGGAALGMQRQYWSNNVTAVLDWINRHAPPRASVYFHEVNVESFRAYQADGQIRADIRYARSPAKAQIAAYQYHQEFRDREFEIWSEFGTRVPAVSFALDEAPQIVVYQRPVLDEPEAP